MATRNTSLISVFAVSSLLAIAAPARATLTLTTSGINLGFTASTFVSGLPDIPGFNEGPFGLALTGNDNVLVMDYANATRYVFADVDNQTPADALNTVFATPTSQGYASGVGAAYGGNGANFVKFNDDGTEAGTLVPTATPYLGMAADPVSGHLIATTTNQGLIDIDPVANTFRVIQATIGSTGDGVSLSPDGSIAYVGFYGTGHVLGYSVANGSIVFDSGSIGHFPDGTGVIASNNSLNGMIVVNGEDGDVLLVDPNGATGNFVIIATTGQRGDYVAADRSNGTLLLDYSTEVDRLSCGQNCFIGSPMPSVPETQTWAMFAAGLGLLPFVVRRRRRT